MQPMELPAKWKESRQRAVANWSMKSTNDSMPWGQYSSRVSERPKPGMSGQYTRKPFSPK